MFTTLAETYMTASRVDSLFGYRAGETERLHMLAMRREEARRWIAEQERAAAKARRRARVTRAMALVGGGLEWLGGALARAGRAMAARREPQCC